MKRIWIHACLTLALLLAALAPAHATPPIQQARLDNGLRVLLMEAHDVPMVVMQLSLPAGSRFDPEGRGGTASLLAAMLSDHTARHDYRSWAAHLDAEAIRLGTGVDREMLSLTLTVLKEALDTGVDALAEAALMPGWDAGRFRVLRDDSIAAAVKSLEEPGVQASRLAARLLFGDHPYGHRPEGDEASLKRIRLRDLKALYQRQFRPDGAVLAVSGDVTMEELLARIRPALAGWKGRPAVARGEIAAPVPVSGREARKAMPTRQALVQLVRLGPARGDAAFFADMLMNHILGGGGFASRLMTEVREKRGLVYGVYSYFMPLTVPGPFAITLQTRADQAGQALKVVEDVLRDMAAGRITKRELAEAKANLIGSFAHRMDSNAKRVRLMSMVGFYDLPLDYLQTWTRHVRAVSLDEVRHQAQVYLSPQAWNHIIVGPAAGSAGGEHEKDHSDR